MLGQQSGTLNMDYKARNMDYKAREFEEKWFQIGRHRKWSSKCHFEVAGITAGGACSYCSNPVASDFLGQRLWVVPVS
jgi:hypothetical protein